MKSHGKKMPAKDMDPLHFSLGRGKDFTLPQINAVQELVKIGRALSAEKDHDRLLGMIVDAAKSFTNADGCTLYIRSADKKQLEFKIIRNDSLNLFYDSHNQQDIWPLVPLYLDDGKENHSNVSAHCALTGAAINIADVYSADFDFQGTREFDKKTSYRSQSMLVIPMKNHEDEVIGVVQLLNAIDPQTGDITSFSDSESAIVTSLASQAAISITNSNLIEGLEKFLRSIIKMMGAAVDAKSPYTAGHVARVVELSNELLEAANKETSGPFKNTFFSDKEREMLLYAAWMHDVGKMTTPEYVIDKATKLETVYDRIELIEYKIELLKKNQEIALLRKKIGEDDDLCLSDYKTEEEIQLNDLLALIEKANSGEYFLQDQEAQRLEELTSFEVSVGQKHVPLLTEDELINLMIRKGTLNSREREIIQNHVRLTQKMLSSLPFPERMKSVPTIASMHHELLDGSGYPNALKGDDLPLSARILVVSDIFEALTAADRPYKKGKRLSEAMKIIHFMVADNQLDADVCDLLVKAGVACRYANKHLPPIQKDIFEWKGEKYCAEESIAVP